MCSFIEKNYLDEDLVQAVSRYMQSHEFSRIYSILQPYVLPSSRLLDLGSGRGLTSLALAERGVRVISLEHDPSDVVGVGALMKFKRLHELPITALRGDVLQLPFHDNCLDVAFCRSLLHHLIDMNRGLREIRRILKPGGLFLACNEHILSPFSNGRKFLNAHPTVAYGVDERAYPAWIYWWKLYKAGFHQIRFFGYPLEFSEFFQVIQQIPIRASLVTLPVLGRGFAHFLYAFHTVVRRYLLVPEHSLPAISIVAQKPMLHSTQIRRMHLSSDD